MLSRIVVTNLQIPVSGLTAAEARILAVQSKNMEPSSGTSDATENSEQLEQTNPGEGPEAS